MKIVAIDFSMSTKSYDIFFSGCNANPKCEGCHNPESWDFSFGAEWRTKKEKIAKDIKDFSSVIDKIFILGGEPLDQDTFEFTTFLLWLKEQGKEIWLFTRYSIDEVPDYVKEEVDYIKTGRYLPELSTQNNLCYGVRLATSNQTIYKKVDNQWEVDKHEN